MTTMSYQEEKDEQTKRLEERMKLVKHKILVMSGKGGVGKTSVSVNLAASLALRGYKTGILDTDIHGPNIAKMLGVQGSLVGEADAIDPIEALPGLLAASMAFTGIGNDDAVIWRGPVKIGVIRQFLADIVWGDLDFLVIDSPPGTGDEPLTVCQLLPEMDGAVVVTTPQEVAILDSRKSVTFARKLSIPVLGIVENMSGLVCPHCGEVIELFGSGGGERAANDLSVPFLGKVPLDPQAVKDSDAGTPVVIAHKESPAAKALNSVVERVLKTVDPA
jgi:ATP-binding protein involved in chromosome partitioning